MSAEEDRGDDGCECASASTSGCDVGVGVCGYVTGVYVMRMEMGQSGASHCLCSEQGWWSSTEGWWAER